jgi:glycosyltransferase 2 family protein
MSVTKIIKALLSLVILAVIAVFFYKQFEVNIGSFSEYKLNLNYYYILCSLILIVLSTLLETYAWFICINKFSNKNKVSFIESFSIVNASALFKYVPGKIWTYAVQVLWCKNRDIPKTITVYINILVFIGAFFVCIFLGIIYLLFTFKNFFMPLVSALIVFFICNIAFVLWNTSILNWLIKHINKYFKREIQHIKIQHGLFQLIELIYTLNWVIIGFSGYILAIGLGLNVSPQEVLAITASMSVSWLIGYVSAVTPGGLGIREGVMYFMLHNIVPIHVALILPVASRVFFLFVEVLTGATGVLIGIRKNIFHDER